MGENQVPIDRESVNTKELVVDPIKERRVALEMEGLRIRVFRANTRGNGYSSKTRVLRAVTVLYGDTASVYGIRTEAAGMQPVRCVKLHETYPVTASTAVYTALTVIIVWIEAVSQVDYTVYGRLRTRQLLVNRRVINVLYQRGEWRKYWSRPRRPRAGPHDDATLAFREEDPGDGHPTPISLQARIHTSINCEELFFECALHHLDSKANITHPRPASRCLRLGYLVTKKIGAREIEQVNEWQLGLRIGLGLGRIHHGVIAPSTTRVQTDEFRWNG
ncbi:hypothetical protein EDD85DRAFT_796629 [Armillaria nabsnona]|nr:hypothetical protein EDD85DRAFT_796629 [Armillaria nabsnona]